MKEKLMSNVNWGSANREKAAVHSEAVHSPRPSSPGARISSLSQATGKTRLQRTSSAMGSNGSCI